MKEYNIYQLERLAESVKIFNKAMIEIKTTSNIEYLQELNETIIRAGGEIFGLQYGKDRIYTFNTIAGKYMKTLKNIK